ncbi:MAG: hypothetical protein ACP5F1_00905 [Thermoplasmata archaeon]|nr:hypothetical protein [Thermoplasmata archaeon]
MANKKQNTGKKEQNEKDEYLDFLEETLSEFTLALLIDMEKHGIFEEKNEEFNVTDKFMDKLMDISMQNLNSGLDSDEVIEESVISAIKEFYGDQLVEEEIYPRADIVISFVLQDLEDAIKDNASK